MSTDDTQHLIWSLQHSGWWNPGGWGYTSSLFEAGRFTNVEADKHLGWAGHREWLDDGRPHEVVIEAPTAEEMASVHVLLTVKDRVGQATTEAIAQRAASVTR